MDKIITITKAESTLTTTKKQLIKIKDENNLSYQLWPIKQDGNESKAYQYYKTLPASGLGMTVSVSIKEEQGNYNGKPVTYRTILGMKPAQQLPVSSQVAKLGRAVQSQQSDDEKWDKISWGKCKTLFLVEAFKRGYDKNDVNQLKEIEREAEFWADMAMRKIGKVEDTIIKEFGGRVVEEPLPPQEEDEIQIDDIPF